MRQPKQLRLHKHQNSKRDRINLAAERMPNGLFKEANMKKPWKIFIILICLFFPWSYVEGADLAKQGEGNYKAGMSAVLKTLPMENERIEFIFEVAGVVMEAPENSPLYNATFWALGESHAIKNDYDERGFIRYVRFNGDFVFAKYEAKGKLGGERKIKIVFVGGTGKCAGITGGGEFNGVSGLQPPKEGVAISVSVGKFNWKIP